MSASLHSLGHRPHTMPQRHHCGELGLAPITGVSSYWMAVGAAGIALSVAGRGPVCVKTTLQGAAWFVAGAVGFVWARNQVNGSSK